MTIIMLIRPFRFAPFVAIQWLIFSSRKRSFVQVQAVFPAMEKQTIVQPPDVEV